MAKMKSIAKIMEALDRDALRARLAELDREALLIEQLLNVLDGLPTMNGPDRPSSVARQASRVDIEQRRAELDGHKLAITNFLIGKGPKTFDEIKEVMKIDGRVLRGLLGSATFDLMRDGKYRMAK